MISPSRSKPIVLFLAVWAVVLYAALILAVFLHEDGHGIGARLDGVHVSTGFNRIGNPGRAPGDPDFRDDVATGGVLTGLLGPATSWLLAIVFTFWLTRRRPPDRVNADRAPLGGTLLIGAFAVANATVRAIPMWSVLSAALSGQVVLEDESYWGIWYIGKVVRPELGSAGALALVNTQPDVLLGYPAIWVCVLVSLTISLACFVVAYRHLLKLWDAFLDSPAARVTLVGLPVVLWFLALPLLNALDRVIRINW